MIIFIINKFIVRSSYIFKAICSAYTEINLQATSFSSLINVVSRNNLVKTYRRSIQNIREEDKWQAKNFYWFV